MNKNKVLRTPEEKIKAVRHALLKTFTCRTCHKDHPLTDKVLRSPAECRSCAKPRIYQRTTRVKWQ